MYIFAFFLENIVISTTQITILSPNSALIRASFHLLSPAKVKDIRSGSKEGFYLTKPQKNRLWGVIREAFDREGSLFIQFGEKGRFFYRQIGVPMAVIIWTNPKKRRTNYT